MADVRVEQIARLTQEIDLGRFQALDVERPAPKLDVLGEHTNDGLVTSLPASREARQKDLFLDLEVTLSVTVPELEERGASIRHVPGIGASQLPCRDKPTVMVMR